MVKLVVIYFSSKNAYIFSSIIFYAIQNISEIKTTNLDV